MSCAGTRISDYLLIGLVVLADAALLLPARATGWLVALHVLVRLAVGLRSSSHGNALGLLVVGYRSGNRLRGMASIVALITLVSYLVALQAISLPAVSVDSLVTGVLPWVLGRCVRARPPASDSRQRIEIARDLHDAITQHVSAVGLHAGVTRLQVAGGDDALKAVQTASSAAMKDLQRLHHVLHEGTAPPTRQAGWRDIDALADMVRQQGLRVRLETTGTASPLSFSLDIFLYRIAEEMLADALRGGASEVEITLSYGPSSVSLTESTRPETRRSPGPRSGIRCRAAVFGGTVDQDSDSTGGRTAITVTFPLS